VADWTAVGEVVDKILDLLKRVRLEVWIALGGALGAVARFWVASAVQKKVGILFPAGTLAVNVLGSFLIGFFFVYFLEFLGSPVQVRAFAVVGFLGAFTTFSSYSYEAVSLMLEGEWGKALFYALASNLLCFAATLLGMAAARSVTRI
jgi:CrcB protein